MPVAPPVTTATLPRSSPSLIPADVQVDAVARLRHDRHLPRAPQTLHARTTEGMVALSLVAEDVEALIAAFDRGGVECVRRMGEGTVGPRSRHGGDMHIRRYEGR